MPELNEPGDFLTDINAKKTLPGTLNVLTILTFIGCGIGALFTFVMPAFMGWSLKMMDKAQEQSSQLTEKQATDIEKGRLAIIKFMDNKWAIILIGVVGIALCLYGALNMRKLKKEGFYVYVIGQIAPIIASTLLLGFAVQFNGVMSYLLGLAVPVLFIILYARNLKYLK